MVNYVRYYNFLVEVYKMKVFNCIFGVFAFLGAIYCIAFPGLTFINSGWLVSILLGVWGICAIFDYATNKNNPENSKATGAMGAVGLVAGIGAAVISVLAVFTPSIQVLLDMTILCLFAGWLVISGITSTAVALKAKGLGGKGWILSLVLGILVLLSGVYGFFHLIFMAQTIGILSGMLLMVYGFRLICTVFEKN